MLLLRGATERRLRQRRNVRFQYMLLLRGATQGFQQLFKRGFVSIHAPLARSNEEVSSSQIGAGLFQYMLLLRGATRLEVLISGQESFNTCSSCEEQLSPEFVRPDSEVVSIHAPLARSNKPPRSGAKSTFCFNTCSSCEEQLRGMGRRGACALFQYMLLLRGATIFAENNAVCRLFQYMLLLRGATCGFRRKQRGSLCFNTCSSCEEQLALFVVVDLRSSFNTCSSCEEQHFSPYKLAADFLFQYMLLLRGATESA